MLAKPTVRGPKRSSPENENFTELSPNPAQGRTATAQSCPAPTWPCHLRRPPATAERRKKGAGQPPGTMSRESEPPGVRHGPTTRGALPHRSHCPGAQLQPRPYGGHAPLTGATHLSRRLDSHRLPPRPLPPRTRSAAAGPRLPPRSSSGGRNSAPYLRAAPQPSSPRPQSPPAKTAAGGRELEPSQRAGPGRCRPPAPPLLGRAPRRASPRGRHFARVPECLCRPVSPAAAPPPGLGPPRWRSSCSAGRWSPPNGSRRPCGPGGSGRVCGCWTPPGTRHRTEMPGRSSRRGTFPGRSSSTSRSAETCPPRMTSCCPVSPTLPTTWDAWGSATTPTWWCTTGTSWAPSTPPAPGGCSGPSGTNRSRCWTAASRTGWRRATLSRQRSASPPQPSLRPGWTGPCWRPLRRWCTMWGPCSSRWWIPAPRAGSGGPSWTKVTEVGMAPAPCTREDEYQYYSRHNNSPRLGIFLIPQPNLFNYLKESTAEHLNPSALTECSSCRWL